MSTLQYVGDGVTPHGAGALAEVLRAAARGEFPPADGGFTVLPQPGPRDAGVLGMSAHAVIFADVEPGWVRKALLAASPDQLAAPLGPAFLVALGAETGRRVNIVDMLTVAPALPGRPEVPLTEIIETDHPRVVRARRFRDAVRVWTTDGGVLVLGRGVAGRWEIAIEVDEDARGRGLGRALALAGRQLLPEGELLWSQQPPGNARSVRAFQAAGFRPVGGEALLVVDGPAAG
ncbi:GNAT family N-acetyltransferase [Streptomyces sp. 3MP-14]|uniref:GNAT family N-acetyltransferase n=1 Tax=Streptomyces mimosae TaxID=2586635 RepID=A0A5N6AFZ1_9ACTN|nr:MULTISPECIES: GNAT family N-acetyltransferase [Streptomyces]KAB8167767.1 GNAT family N-acetyltransferase [Streptomyces mimosae]KAB8177585.1 GNAT family N-acetyltransferase [Streptomyces sp. 3MP-14]